MRNRKSNTERIVPFNLRLPESLHKRIVAVAEAEHRSAAAEMRRALAAHCEAHEKKGAAA